MVSSNLIINSNITEFTFLIFLLSLNPVRSIKVSSDIPVYRKKAYEDNIKFLIGLKNGDPDEDLNDTFFELTELSEIPGCSPVIWAWITG